MTIILTDAAAARVKRFLVGRNILAGLRFGVKKAGCTGFTYVVNLDDKPEQDDIVYESNGIRVFVDATSLPYVDGTSIDFTRDGLNETFQYHNPNIKSACGCGESFSI